MEEPKPDQKPDAEKSADPQREAKISPPPRTPLRQRLKAKFNKVSKSEVAEVIKDTAEDLKSNNKERVGLAVATVIPGGWIAYYAHRHHKFKKKHGNDDKPEADAPQQPAPPGKSAPPKP